MSNSPGLDFRVWNGKQTKNESSQPETKITYPSDFEDTTSKSNSDKSEQIYEEDAGPSEEQTEEQCAEVLLSEGAFSEGSNGFDFLKDCKISVKVDLPDDKASKKVTFKLFSSYNDEEFDHQFQVEGFVKDGYAEAEIPQLFHDENFYQDTEKPPDAKCNYFFKASHKDCKSELTSEFLEMPLEDFGKFEVLFAIDPNSDESQDDKLILYSTDEEGTYIQEKTPQDNISENPEETIIEFTEIPKKLNFSLGVDPGKEGDPYLVFENRPFGQWFDESPDNAMKNEFRAQFKIDPNEASSSDDKFILFSVDDNQTYKQQKTVKDDLTSDDDTVEIVFDDLDRELSYSLQVDPGKEGEPYFVFENRPFNDLSKGNT